MVEVISKEMRLFALIWVLVLIERCQTVRVQFSTGILEGRSLRVGPRTVNVFKNVPFAEPPIGSLRFQSPKPKRSWRGIWNGTEYSRPCMSNTSFTTSPQKNVGEDCLYLNIFADERCLRKACPILFYIHGGNFYYDSAVMFNDTEIIQRYASDKMIFIIPAYRMGLFGFLDLGHELEDSPYNVGMQDLILALRWVQKEGHRVGGNIKKITAMGNSGGASALEYLIVTPVLERNTFDKVIISSGIPYIIPHANLEVTRMVVERLKCDKFENGTELSMPEKLECLKRCPAKDISDATREDENKWTNLGPQTDEILLPGRDYNELLQQYFKATTMLITTTKDELVDKPRGRDTRRLCLTYFSVYGYHSDTTLDACAQFYHDDNSDIAKDAFHAITVHLAIENTIRGKPAFVGVFAQINHTHHANDLTYFFGLHPIANMTENDKRMDAYYPKMIKRFIKTGSPESDWPPANKKGENFYFLNFDRNASIVPHPVRGVIYEYDPFNFWTNELAEVEWGATHNSSEHYRRSSHNRFMPIETKSMELNNSVDPSPFSADNMFSITSSQVWVAFWTILTLAIILATIILIMTASRLMFTYQSNREYTIATAGEGTKILTRQVKRYM